MKPEEIWHRFENPEAPKVNHRLARYHLHSIRFGKRMKKLSMVLRYSAGIRDLAEMNEHLIEQLIVGRKHKKVQGRLLEKDKVLSLDEAIIDLG